MLPLNRDEVVQIAKSLEGALDARLQKCFHTSSGFVFEFFGAHPKGPKTFFWVLDLNPQRLVLLDYEKIPTKIIKKQTPLELFLKTHFYGKRLASIAVSEEFDRVLDLSFGYEEPFTMQIRLFPHGQNVILVANKKKISLNPVKELKKSNVQLDKVKYSVRSMEAIKKEWEQSLQPKKEPSSEEKKEKILEKKKKAIDSLRDQLKELEEKKWAEVGAYILENQNLEVPQQFLEYVDKKKTLSWNIEKVFGESKKIKTKILGMSQRIIELEREALELENSSGNFLEKTSQKLNSNKKNKSTWKGHRMSLDDKIEVFVGRNATENLSVIREAQSWDLWLHLKDYPGAHGIVRRPRGVEISREQLDKVARFVAKHSKKSSHFLNEGDVFEVLVVERRFVRPIKGDKLGRVNYTNETVLRVRM